MAIDYYYVEAAPNCAGREVVRATCMKEGEEWEYECAGGEITMGHPRGAHQTRLYYNNRSGASKQGDCGSDFYQEVLRHVRNPTMGYCRHSHVPEESAWKVEFSQNDLGD